MNTKKEIEKHKLPCGPVTVAIDAVCRRRLRDQYDSLLDRLTEETHPEGADPEAEDLQDEHEMQEEAKKAREAAENTVGQDLDAFDKHLEDMASHESLDDTKERLIEEGKMKADVKHEVQKYSDKLMGNSKMAQNPKQKITTRKKR